MAYKKSVYEKAAQRLEARRKKAEDEQKLLRFRANPSDESWITQ